MRILGAIVRLTRLDSCLLALLAVFLPLWLRTGSVSQGLFKSIPLLFSFMCTFIANDLDDIEKDQINHPERPLPAGQIAPVVAAVLYFFCLGLALFSTHYFVSPGIAFLYYALIALLISYGHIVEWLPGLKAPYVATVITIPVLMVATFFPQDAKLYRVAVAAFFLVLAREICMDIRDRRGDVVSFMHQFRATRLAVFGFFLQLVGLVVLASLTRSVGASIALLMMTATFILSGLSWFKFSRYRLSIILMKLEWFVGLYFLT